MLQFKCCGRSETRFSFFLLFVYLFLYSTMRKSSENLTSGRPQLVDLTVDCIKLILSQITITTSYAEAFI